MPRPRRWRTRSTMGCAYVVAHGAQRQHMRLSCQQLDVIPASDPAVRGPPHMTASRLGWASSAPIADPVSAITEPNSGGVAGSVGVRRGACRRIPRIRS